MSEQCLAASICCSFVVFLTLMIMLITSFVYVEYDELAFKKSTTTNKIDQSEVYSNGRYLWGFDHTKVPFPKLFQKQELSLSVANEEGVSVTIAVSFWYRLPKEHLSDIYSAYGLEYSTQLTSIARAAVRNSAVDFGVDAFLTDRAAVRALIAENLPIALAEMNIDCLGYTVQLNEITFSAELLDTHMDSAVTLENNLKIGYEQTAREIRAETERQVEEYSANTTVITRTAEANKTAMIETAQAEYDEIITQARGQGMADTMSALGITAADEKARFLKLMAILDNDESKIVEINSGAVINLN